MEIIRRNIDGTETCFIRCEEHNWYFKGQPPMTVGCKECWKTYYFSLRCLASDNEQIDMLDEALHHAVESIAQGKFDFKILDTPEVDIKKELS